MTQQRKGTFEDNEALVRRFLRVARNRRMDPSNPEARAAYNEFAVKGNGDPGVERRAVFLWLDDVRSAPAGWTWVSSVDEAIEILSQNDVIEASLDADLLIDASAPQGLNLVEWMVENRCWPRDALTVHTDNRIESAKMCRLIQRHAGYEDKVGRRFSNGNFSARQRGR